MNFAPIVPTKLLPQIKGRPVQFCLAHLCDRQPYLEFYKEEVKAGATVILDNGAYEGQLMDFDDLAQVISDLSPTAFVLPDVIGDHKMTLYLADAFRSYWHANQVTCGISDEASPFFICVPQGKDIWELIAAYKDACERGNTWIGLTREMVCTAGVKRSELVSRLQQLNLWCPSMYHHALGMIGGNLEEVRWLAGEGVNSCDSSNPVWRACLKKDGHFNVDNTDYVNSRVITDYLTAIDKTLKGGTLCQPKNNS